MDLTAYDDDGGVLEGLQAGVALAVAAQVEAVAGDDGEDVVKVVVVVRKRDRAASHHGQNMGDKAVVTLSHQRRVRGDGPAFGRRRHILDVDDDALRRRRGRVVFVRGPVGASVVAWVLAARLQAQRHGADDDTERDCGTCSLGGATTQQADEKQAADNHQNRTVSCVAMMLSVAPPVSLICAVILTRTPSVIQ